MSDSSSCDARQQHVQVLLHVQVEAIGGNLIASASREQVGTSALAKCIQEPLDRLTKGEVLASEQAGFTNGHGGCRWHTMWTL